MDGLFPSSPGPIGVFDSGYGGLTILNQMRRRLPQYDYIYLGDNARAPYGPRSFDVVYRFTREAVMQLFSMGCHLVILACNTASAKALRTLQQNDLPKTDPDRRVLGVIRPTAEAIPPLTVSRHVGILATEGTIRSRSYDIEIAHQAPDIIVTGQACPLWAAIVEANEADSDGADCFVGKRIGELLKRDPVIDTIVLACTHYPLLMKTIMRHVPEGIKVVSQGEYVAGSLADYLKRHTGMEVRLTRGGTCRYLTTENPGSFTERAQIFLNRPVTVDNVTLG